jgi:hypothetical protein
MKRLLLLASLITACSKSAPEAETQSVQPALPASNERGADPLDGVAREAEAPVTEQPAPPAEAEVDPDAPRELEMTEPVEGPRPRPDPRTEPTMSARDRRNVGDPLDGLENALQLDE